MIFERLIAPFRRNPPPVVSVIRLDGIIGPAGNFRPGINLAALAPVIERAFAPKRQKAVALLINSPGGSPVQSALVAGRIRQLADEKKVPVFAFTEDVAASGGYWLACAADEIFAAESSIVGSIGVISAGFGFQDLISRYGVERRVHTSGTRKAMLDPFQPEDPEDVVRLVAIQREIHEYFKAHVRGRRAGRLKAPEDDLFTGEFWTGRRALDLGLIDGIGDQRGVMRGRFGEKVKLRVVHAERGWLRSRLRLEEGEVLGRGIAAEKVGEAAGAAVETALGLLEERLARARFGL